MTLTNDEVSGVLRISGVLDIDSADSLREALRSCLLLQPHVTADLSEVQACDTAGLQVLLAGRSNAASLGKPFHFHAISPAVAEMAAALGLDLQAPAGKAWQIVGVGGDHPDAA
jgi:anti-anti-sigma factor